MLGGESSESSAHARKSLCSCEVHIQYQYALAHTILHIHSIVHTYAAVEQRRGARARTQRGAGAQKGGGRRRWQLD